MSNKKVDLMFAGRDVPDGKFTGYRMEPDGMNYPAAGYRKPDNSRQFRAILSQFRAILSVFDKFFDKNLSKLYSL